MVPTAWEPVTDDVRMFRDSCRVYAVRGSDGMVIVNAGTGAWLDHVGELPGPVAAVVCTHFFRDHSAGAAEAARRGIPVHAPWWEREPFADPLGLFQRRETYIIYDNVWDLFCPIEPIPVSGWLHDWDEVSLGGRRFRVVPAPGVTLGAISLVTTAEDGRRIAFCGELIHSPGRIPRVAPLQYDYNDLGGAVNMVYALGLLRKETPAVLCPSLGDPILRDADGALASVESSLRAMVDPRPGYREALAAIDRDELIRVSDHVYQSALGSASTWFVISDSGKALAIDYGYRSPEMRPSYPYPRNRRPMLHGLEPLRRRFGIDRIDVVLLSHFHDDHVNGVPMLQRLHGTRCWAGENFAAIPADPQGWNFPCTWPEPVRVDPKPLETPFPWEEYTFRLFPMSGHTRWSTIVSFEADGKRFAATGDQYFFWDGDVTDFANHECMDNHVYRNGARLRSFAESNALMRRLRPQVILPGHGAAYETDDTYFDALDRYANRYETLHRRLMPLGERDVHFDVDSRAGWLTPYRVRLDRAGPVRFHATIRNPLPERARLAVGLVGPAGWKGNTAEGEAGPREEIGIDLEIVPPRGTVCRRQPIALELRANEQRFGQIAEALVTIGHDLF